MTRSNPRSPQAQQAALSAAFSSAVDLSALKRPPAAPGGAAPAAASPFVVDVTEATFATDVVDKSTQVLVVVDLYSPRSPVSAQLSPMLEKLVLAYNGAVVLARVDVDVSPRIGQAFGVQAIPTVVAVAAGQPVDAFSGAQPEQQVSGWLQSLVEALADRLPGLAGAGDPNTVDAEPEPDPLLLAAEAALEEGDFDAAIAAYQQLADADPTNLEAGLAVAQLRFQQRVLALPADAVELAAADPDNVALQLDAADSLFAAGDSEASFELLVGLIAGLAGDEKIAGKDHMLELFALLGNDDPQVIKYRRRLAAALY